MYCICFTPNDWTRHWSQWVLPNKICINNNLLTQNIIPFRRRNCMCIDKYYLKQCARTQTRVFAHSKWNWASAMCSPRDSMRPLTRKWTETALWFKGEGFLHFEVFAKAISNNTSSYSLTKLEDHMESHSLCRTSITRQPMENRLVIKLSLLLYLLFIIK